MEKPLTNNQLIVENRILKNQLDELRADNKLLAFHADSFWKMAIDGTGDGIWDWDILTDTFSYSSQWKTMLGYNDDDGICTDSGWEAYLHYSDINGVRETINSYLLGEIDKYRIECRLKCKDGSYKWILRKGTVVEWNKNKPSRIVGTHTDITERKELERKLERTHTLLRTVMDTTPIRVFWKDLNLNYLGCNIGFAKDAGKACTDDVIGKDDYSMGWHNQADTYRFNDLQVINSGESKLFFEEKQTTIDGKTVWLRTSKVPLKEGDTVIGVLGVYEDITEYKSHVDEIKQLAFFDPLTKLPNRRLLADRFDSAVKRAKRDSTQIAILMLDLDRFKGVNDKFGHITGDQLLQQVATRISDKVRAIDTTARLGGDEFVIMLEDVTSIKEANKIAQSIIDCLSLTFHLNGHDINIGASIGLSMYPEHGKSYADLLDAADRSMYISKETGRGKYTCCDTKSIIKK